MFSASGHLLITFNSSNNPISYYKVLVINWTPRYSAGPNVDENWKLNTNQFSTDFRHPITEIWRRPFWRQIGEIVSWLGGSCDANWKCSVLKKKMNKPGPLCNLTWFCLPFGTTFFLWPTNNCSRYSYDVILVKLWL